MCIAASNSTPSSTTPTHAPTNTTTARTSDAHSDTETAARRLRKGDIIDVTITRIGYGGTSIGRITNSWVTDKKGDSSHIISEDFALPVHAPKGACPGDVVQCLVKRLRRRKKNVDIASGSSQVVEERDRGGEASTVKETTGDSAMDRAAAHSFVEAAFAKLVSRSPASQPPACKHFGHLRLGGQACGGCTSMQLPYNMQVAQKDAQIQSLYAFIAQAHGVSVEPIVACEKTLEFRNKMEFTFGRRWYNTKGETEFGNSANTARKYALGLHPPQRYDKVLEIHNCRLQSDVCNRILQFVRSAAEDMLLEPFDTRTNRGYLRNVAIRTACNAKNEQEVMVNIITSECEVHERLVPLAESLRSAFPEIVCVVQNIRGIGGIHVIDESQERLLAGSRSYIEQMLCGVKYRLSANSFFQTNPTQAEVLYAGVRRAARLSGDDTVLDLFCGTGTIGLSLAAGAKHVYGVDVTASAIEDARVNAQANGIGNATFVQMNLDKLRFAKQFVDLPEADVVVIDPPRAGLHPDLIKYFVERPPKRIVYVSCNPMTQVRDITLLMRQAHVVPFRVSSIQPVDMFPNSHHVECIVALDRTV